MKKIVQCFSASSFLKENESQLLKEETKNNLLLGLAASVENKQLEADEAVFYTLYESQEPIAQALRTDPSKALILSTMSPDSAKFLAKELSKSDLNLAGVCGPYDITQIFVDHYPSSAELIMHQGIYELNQLNDISVAPGEMILAKDKHLSIVSDFSQGFVLDCFPKMDKKQEAIEAAKRNIKNQNLYLWVNTNGEITSMAAKNRESQNAATIGWVYTPQRYRGHGYGTQIVMALTKLILRNGKTKCNLFTDLLNPTSNAIYQKIGYKKIGENAHYNF